MYVIWNSVMEGNVVYISYWFEPIFIGFVLHLV